MKKAKFMKMVAQWQTSFVYRKGSSRPEYKKVDAIRIINEITNMGGKCEEPLNMVEYAEWEKVLCAAIRNCPAKYL